MNSLISLNSRVCLYPELSVQHKKDLSAQDLSYILSEIIIQQSQFITVSAYHLSYILYKEDKKVYLICSILILIPNYIFKCRIKAFTWIRQFYYLINMAILIKYSFSYKRMFIDSKKGYECKWIWETIQLTLIHNTKI